MLVNLEFCNGIAVGEDRQQDDARKERKKGNLLWKFRGQITIVHAGSLHLFNILAEMVMRETLDGLQGWLSIGGRMITNLRYADNVILLASAEAELQDRLDRVKRKKSPLINVDKTKVMARDSIASRIIIQNEQLEQVDTFAIPIPWVPDYRR